MENDTRVVGRAIMSDVLPADAVAYCNQQTNPNTREAYFYDLKGWFAFLGDREPNREIAIEWRYHLEGNFSPRSAGRKYNTCRAYYRWLRKDNPFEAIKSPRRLRNAVPRVPADAVIDRLIAGAHSARDGAIIAALANGLRVSEVTGLTPGDWQWSEHYSRFIVRVRGKGSKERLVPANAELAQAMSRYLPMRKPGSAFVFEALRGTERMTRKQVQVALERACRNAGVDRVNPHSLRHHYGTRLARAGVDVLTLQKLLGHESPDTTAIYVHLDLGDIVKAVGLDPRDRKDNHEDFTYSGTAFQYSEAGTGGTGTGLPRIH
jgi:site-specific recombinase XerD